MRRMLSALGRIVARRRLLEDPSLDFLVGYRAEGLGEIESDFARCQCLEHDGCKGRETQPAFDEADRQPEAARDILRRGTASISAAKACASSAGFIARRWKFSARLVSTAISASSSSTRQVTS
jgi:hypothetical protein